MKSKLSNNQYITQKKSVRSNNNIEQLINFIVILTIFVPTIAKGQQSISNNNQYGFTSTVSNGTSYTTAPLPPQTPIAAMMPYGYSGYAAPANIGIYASGNGVAGMSPELLAYQQQIASLNNGYYTPYYQGNATSYYEPFQYSQQYSQQMFPGQVVSWQQSDTQHQEQSRPSTPKNDNLTSSPYMPIRSPLLETTWEQAKLMNPFNAPTGPHRGVGKPLEDQSWLDRPYYFGVFGGWVSGTPLIDKQIDQGSGSDCGVTLGWNMNHYWGLEGRLFSSSIDINDISGTTNTPNRTNKLSTLDVSVHYYPYGEAKWRPYLKLGIGGVQERFQDNNGIDQKYNTWSMPIGGGIKYWWSERVSIYADVVDNIVFGKGMAETTSNWTLNFGVNFSFGTNPTHHPTVYWPQTTSKPY